MSTDIYRLVVGLTELSEFADLGGILIVPGVTAFPQIIKMRETEPWETDWIVISSKEATGQAS